MMKNDKDLEHLLRPKSIAIIGASERGMYPSGVLENLQRYGYEGRIFPVNPRRETVLGLRSYPKIIDIEEDVDLAVVIVPRGFSIDILQQCAEKGVRGALIISAGFGEADEYGKELQKDLNDFPKETGVRIIGPNCAGFANITDNTVLTLLDGRSTSSGNVAFISQSGAMMIALYGCFRDKEVGLSYVISTGNQVDLEISDFIRYCVDDPNTKVISTFIEGIKDADKFLDTADYALEKGKPIIVLKVGRTEAGAAAAITHTGSIVGADFVYDAIFKQNGMTRVDDLDELVDTAKVFSLFSDYQLEGEGIGILSQSGGMASLAADICFKLGLNLPELSGDTLDEILALDHLLTFGILRNPADVRGAGTQGPTIGKTIEPMIRDEKFANLVILLARPVTRGRDIETAEGIIKITKTTKKPIFVVWTGRKIMDPENSSGLSAYRILETSGVPIFDNCESCFKIIKHLIDYHRFRYEYVNEVGSEGD